MKISKLVDKLLLDIYRFNELSNNTLKRFDAKNILNGLKYLRNKQYIDLEFYLGGNYSIFGITEKGIDYIEKERSAKLWNWLERIMFLLIGGTITFLVSLLLKSF